MVKKTIFTTDTKPNDINVRRGDLWIPPANVDGFKANEFYICNREYVNGSTQFVPANDKKVERFYTPTVS